MRAGKFPETFHPKSDFTLTMETFQKFLEIGNFCITGCDTTLHNMQTWLYFRIFADGGGGHFKGGIVEDQRAPTRGGGFCRNSGQGEAPPLK